jgi:alanine-synthesizing transaminase
MEMTAEDVFIGNGVSECIDMALRAMLNSGDQVLVPSPDYPLWSASISLNQGKPVYYNCLPSNGFQPDPDEISSLVTPQTRAIVVINPNNPTGAVYDREVLKAIAEIAERNKLVILSDEIYDEMRYDDAQYTPMATLVHDTLCGTFNGLSKVYRACGYRVGWIAFSGNREQAQEYLHAVELLASLRLCANVPGQWAVQTALGGFQSICELTAPGGRLYQAREAVIKGVAKSKYLSLCEPRGSMYAFPGVDTSQLATFDDQAFAMELLEKKHVLIAPGSSFNVPYRNHFRLSMLPTERKLDVVFGRIEEVLDSMAAGHGNQ